MTRDKAQALKWSTVTGVVVFMLTCFGWVASGKQMVENIVSETINQSLEPVKVEIRTISKGIDSHDEKISRLYGMNAESKERMEAINTDLRVLTESTRSLKESVDRLSRKLGD